MARTELDAQPRLWPLTSNKLTEIAEFKMHTQVLKAFFIAPLSRCVRHLGLNAKKFQHNLPGEKARFGGMRTVICCWGIAVIQLLLTTFFTIFSRWVIVCCISWKPSLAILWIFGISGPDEMLEEPRKSFNLKLQYKTSSTQNGWSGTLTKSVGIYARESTLTLKFRLGQPLGRIEVFRRNYWNVMELPGFTNLVRLVILHCDPAAGLILPAPFTRQFLTEN